MNRAKREATGEAVEACWAMFFTALRDKEGYTAEDLQRVWGEVQYISESVREGYINIADLVYTLRKEAEIGIA